MVGKPHQEHSSGAIGSAATDDHRRSRMRPTAGGAGRDGTAGGLSRRGFLHLAAGGLVIVGSMQTDPLGRHRLAAGDPNRVVHLLLRRREDLLRIAVRAENMVLVDGASGSALRRDRSDRRAYLVVDLGPQSMAEEAFGGSDPLGTRPVGSRLSGSSRLAFVVDHDREIPLTIEHLLDWSRLDMSVVPAARPDGYVADLGESIPVREPSSLETAIEAPWWLILSPPAEARWEHRRTSVASTDGRVELWHTNLAGARRRTLGAQPGRRSSVRAVWSRDDRIEEYLANQRDLETYPEGFDGKAGHGKPFPRMPLGPRERVQIVERSTEFRARRPSPAIDASQLGLSALGAALDVEGRWAGGGHNDLVGWTHRATGGRDGYVEITKEGFLFPYGHRALHVQVTERTGATGPSGRAAYLVQHELLIVVERERAYAGGASAAHGGQGRDLPFTDVAIATTASPALDGHWIASDGDKLGKVFTVKGTGMPYELGMVGRDWIGREVGFSAPVVFVEGREGSYERVSKLADLLADPGATPELASVAVRPMPASPVALAESKQAGDTDVALGELTFGVSVLGDEAKAAMEAGIAAFVPVMSAAKGYLTQAQSLGGSSNELGEGAVNAALDLVDIAYVGTFVEQGLEAANELFAEVGGAAVSFAGETATGLLNGALEVSGLSRAAGAVGGAINDLLNGEITPSSLLEAFGTELIGGIKLSDVISTAVPDPTADLPPEAMRLIQERLSDRVVASFHWEPKLLPSSIFVPGKNARLVVDSTSTMWLPDPVGDLTPPAPSATSTAELSDFTLTLLANPTFLEIRFNRLAFHATTGQKPTIDVDIAAVEFGEALAFVGALQEYLRTGGLGPRIEVDANGASALFALTLPSVQVGVFALQNLAFGIGAHIPFDGTPVRVRADLCSRDDPFLLTVSMFGGGGWASIAFGGDTVEHLEIALEFGASCSMDIGVASGAVSLMAGIYIGMGTGDTAEQCELGGYCRLSGSLEVLGLISVSVEFHMGFSYLPEKNKVYGQATLTVEVDVALFSKTVELSVERYFGGAPGDPTFADLMPGSAGGNSPTWQEYCAAFAPIGAPS